MPQLFTDTGQYILRFDAVTQEIQDPSQPSPPSSTPSSSDGKALTVPSLSLDERAVLLACAVSM
jgi:hypothetical protein